MDLVSLNKMSAEQNEEFGLWIKEIANQGPLLLDVGCGGAKISKNAIGIDPYAENSLVNVQAYMWDMPFGDDSVDGLVCMSALEHISKFQVMPTLQEFNRVLKVGAKFIILVPDLPYALQSFLEKPNIGWEMDLIFGSQVHDGEYHRTGFTEEILRFYFNEAIPNVEILKVYRVNAYSQQNLGVIAQKR